jgi:hypothetical protein
MNNPRFGGYIQAQCSEEECSTTLQNYIDTSTNSGGNNQYSFVNKDTMKGKKMAIKPSNVVASLKLSSM